MKTNPIRIKRILTLPVEHHIRADRIVVSNAGRHDCSRFLLVAVENDQGLRGYGEAATVPLWSGESWQTAQWLIENLFKPKLLDATFDHPAEALALMDNMAVHNSFAKSAVDTALWDLWAKQENRCVFDLFADRKPLGRIVTRASIGAYPIEKTVEIAGIFHEAGIRVFKFKTGVPGLDDVRRLRAVREALGWDVMFTIDYNGGTFANADQAVASIESLLLFKLALVEQPTHRDRLSLMAQVRRRVEVPILADESVFTPEQLSEAIDLDAFDVLSLYPGKNGGFTHCLRMAAMAQQAGKACAIGSNLESDLGQAAMASLAAGLTAFPIPEIPCDLGSSLYYTRSILKRPLPLIDGAIETPVGVGFGIEPNLSFDNGVDPKST